MCLSRLCPAEQSLWTISWLSWQQWRRMQGVTTWRQWMRWPGRVWPVLPSTWAYQVKICPKPQGLRQLIWVSFSQAEQRASTPNYCPWCKTSPEVGSFHNQALLIGDCMIFWLRNSDIPFAGYHFLFCRLQKDWLASREHVEWIQFTGNTTEIHHFN